MSFFKWVILFFCFHVFSVYAGGTINCEPSTTSDGRNYDKWSDIHAPYELKPNVANITLGSNIPDWTILYSIQNAVAGVQSGSCTANVYVNYVMFAPGAKLLNTIDNAKIYATNIPGIGISLYYTNNGADDHFGPYPSYISDSTYSKGRLFGISMRFWKVPGNIPMAGGPISVTGPEMGIVYTNNSGGYTMTSSSPGRIQEFAGGTGYLAGSRVLQATLIFQPGTCNIEGDDIRIDMGNYEESGTGHSDWKDASFKLLCPDAYGYNGRYNSYEDNGYNNPYSVAQHNSEAAKNDKKNGRIQISIVPYTDVVDANKGIIALDGTGAKGYGIQLAWGDYSTQNTAEPSNPVVLNSYVDANSLNSAFLAGDTPIGGNGFSGGDNTIKMSARYIRTTGETAPGPANAVVQVIANYQ